MTLILLGIVAFIQNMMFTWASRSRNSGSPGYHFFAALGSNSTWFICNFFLILPKMLDVFKNGNFNDQLVVMLVYVICTSLGSCLMMKILLV